MTNQEILEKAIAQAQKGGWVNVFLGSNPKVKDVGEPFHDQDIRYWLTDIDGENGFDPFTVIFNHDFAKAFWGEGQPTSELGFHFKMEDGTLTRLPVWQFRLQQQVISDDPIKYLEKGLK